MQEYQQIQKMIVYKYWTNVEQFEKSIFSLQGLDTFFISKIEKTNKQIVKNNNCRKNNNIKMLIFC